MDLDNVVKQIRGLWPDLKVTKEMINKPSPEFVMQFYSHFITSIEERINFSLGWYQDNLNTDLDPEEVIHLKMRKITIFQHLTPDHLLTLADIYDPIPIRTRQIIKVCLHSLTFFDNFSADLEKIDTNILEMKENTSRLANKKEQLLIELNEAAMLKGELIENIEILKQESTEVEDHKETYLLKRSNLEIQFQELRKKLEDHKQNVDEYKRSIANFEKKEKQLLKESISNEEYIALKESITNLETENQSLENDSINMEDLLSQQNKLLGHFRNCIKALPDTFNTDFVNKEISMERELKDMETEMNNLPSQLSSLKTNHVHQIKIFNDSKKTFDQSSLENANIKEDIKKEFDNLSTDVLKRKEELQISLKQCLSENQNCKMEISNLENDLEELREHVSKEYIKIAKAENRVFQRFRKNY